MAGLKRLPKILRHNCALLLRFGMASLCRPIVRFLDYVVPQNAEAADRIEFSGEFRQDAAFYAQIEVTKSLGSSETETWWFKHVADEKGRSPERLPGPEWKFYVTSTDEKKQFDLDLRREVSQVLEAGESLVGLKRLRLRGNISLSPVRLSEKDSVVPGAQSWWTFRKPWRSWTRADKLSLLAIVIGIILTVIVIFVTIYLPEVRIRLGLDKPKVESNAAPPAKDFEPEAKPHEPEIKPLVAESAPSVQEMRRKHRVSLISPMEGDKTTAEVQPNSFGFAFSTPIIYRSPIQIQVSGSKRDFEIHKLADSSLLVVGYVGPETFIRLREGVRPDADVTLYSSPIKEASDLVALPLNRLKCPRSRSVEAAQALDCKVTD
jgi:hypothetical protein